jgi:septal ring factor EnvC (AmiA/AmiB activator)
MTVPAQDKIHKFVGWANLAFAHAERACALVLLCSLTLILTGGCGPQEAPSFKKGRTIAAENIELRKELDRRNKEIKVLKAQYSEKIDEQRERLRKCLQEKEELKEKSRQNVREQVSSVLETVMEENRKLREENARLKAQIEKLQK